MAKVERYLFGDPKVEELLVAAESMAFYIHNNHFPIVVVGGAGAQSAAYMVKQQWKMLFPKEPMPKFIALAQRNRITSGAVSDIGTAKYGEKLFERFPILKKHTSSNIFIMEEYAHTGTAIKLLGETFEKMGFERVKKGVMCIGDYPGWERVAKNFDFAFAISKGHPEFDQRRRSLVREAALKRVDARIAKRFGQLEVHSRLKNELGLVRSQLKSFRSRSKGVGR